MSSTTQRNKIMPDPNKDHDAFLFQMFGGGGASSDNNNNAMKNSISAPSTPQPPRPQVSAASSGGGGRHRKSQSWMEFDPLTPTSVSSEPNADNDADAAAAATADAGDLSQLWNDLSLAVPSLPLTNDEQQTWQSIIGSNNNNNNNKPPLLDYQEEKNDKTKRGSWLGKGKAPAAAAGSSSKGGGHRKTKSMAGRIPSLFGMKKDHNKQMMEDLYQLEDASLNADVGLAPPSVTPPLTPTPRGRTSSADPQMILKQLEALAPPSIHNNNNNNNITPPLTPTRGRTYSADPKMVFKQQQQQQQQQSDAALMPPPPNRGRTYSADPKMVMQQQQQQQQQQEMMMPGTVKASTMDDYHNMRNRTYSAETPQQTQSSPVGNRRRANTDKVALPTSLMMPSTATTTTTTTSATTTPTTATAPSRPPLQQQQQQQQTKKKSHRRVQSVPIVPTSAGKAGASSLQQHQKQQHHDDCSPALLQLLPGMIQELYQVNQESHKKDANSNKANANANNNNNNNNNNAFYKAPQPTSLLTGQEAFDIPWSSEPGSWQLDLPSYTSVRACMRLCRFLETYYHHDNKNNNNNNNKDDTATPSGVLDLKQLVDIPRLVLASFARGIPSNQTKGIAPIHQPVVESLLACGPHITQVRGFFVTTPASATTASTKKNKNNTPEQQLDACRQLLIVERQNKFVCIFTGTATEQQGQGGKAHAATPFRRNPKTSNFCEIPAGHGANNKSAKPKVNADQYAAMMEFPVAQVFALLDQLTEENPFCDIVFTGSAAGGAPLATLAAYLYATTRPTLRVACLTAPPPTTSTDFYEESFRQAVQSTPNLNMVRLEVAGSNSAGSKASATTNTNHDAVGHLLRITPQDPANTSKEGSDRPLATTKPKVHLYKFGQGAPAVTPSHQQVGNAPAVLRSLLPNGNRFQNKEKNDYMSLLEEFDEERWVNDFVPVESKKQERPTTVK